MVLNMNQNNLHDRNFFGDISKAGKTEYWEGTDSEKRFRRNMKHTDTREILEKNDWVNTTIEYKYNSQGFRCDEFEDTDCIVTLGCSYTFGTGLPNNDTFAQRVADYYSLKNYNLGLPGSSNASCFRMAYRWIPILKPKFVVFAQPHRERISIQQENGYEMHIKASHIFEHHLKPYRPWYKMFIENDTNVLLEYEKNTMAVKYICQTNNIPLINFEIEDYLPNEKTIDYARDLLHYGNKTQQRLTDMIIKQIDNLN